MLDYQEYTTRIDHHQGNGSGEEYSHLQGDWALFYEVAKGFIRRVRPEDRQDFLHDLLLTMAKVKVKYQAIGKELTEAGLIRVACYEVAGYWRKQFKRIYGHDCGRCSQGQRRKCKEKDLYPQCPKAIKLEHLDRLITDSEGNQIEFSQMIADDNAVDVVAMLNAKFALQGFPHKFLKVAYKKYAGYPLTPTERTYLCRQRNKACKSSQKSLVLV